MTSRQTDPQAMVRAFGKRSRDLLPIDRSVSLSRRELAAPVVPHHPQQLVAR